MPISKEFVESVRTRLESSPGISTSNLAMELGAAEAMVITAMPVKMRQKARPEDFEDIWAGLSCLDCLPEKKFAAEELGYIWFVKRPDAPGEAADDALAVQFFDKSGGRILSIPMSDAKGREAYTRLSERFAVRPVPKMRCKGCKNCTCSSKHGAHAHSH